MRTAIIGGGASGLALACMLCMKGEQPVLFEKQARVGRKLLSTGNGRCNMTNLNASVKDYHGNRGMITAILDRFSPWDAMDFFAELGLESAADEEGRVYPLSNQAAGVLDALRMYADEHGCETRTETNVTSIEGAKSGFTVVTEKGRERFDRVVIACGGLAAPKIGGCSDGYKLLQKFGHTVTPRYPAIAALKTSAEDVRGLKGIRMHGNIALIADGKTIREEKGEILFAEAGISGIAAMQLAREVNLAIAQGKRCEVRLNLFAEMEKGYIRARAKKLPDRALEDFLSGIVPKRLGQTIIGAAGVRPLTMKAGELTGEQSDRIERELTDRRIKVTGTQGFDNAQVTCGGVPLTQFDGETLESKMQKGLYAIGEVLDVDGDCGGFNLHWAWASAHCVSESI